MYSGSCNCGRLQTYTVLLKEEFGNLLGTIYPLASEIHPRLLQTPRDPTYVDAKVPLTGEFGERGEYGGLFVVLERVF